jgi:ABC-type antimicrobial peptide transport system permease subunit
LSNQKQREPSQLLGQNTQETIAALEKIYHDLNPEYPFSFDFVDKELAEQLLGNLFNVFAGLGIFISCLGLYGLSAFLAERRTKKIGVRKALGASIFNVVFLLSKAFGNRSWLQWP